ncbi:MAG: penicillin-binding protein 2 [Methyloligellaceae bacterium]
MSIFAGDWRGFGPNLPGHILFGGKLRQRGDGRARQAFTALAFAAAFTIIGLRLLWLGGNFASADPAGRHADLSTAVDRPVIVDRRGRILAADIKTGSLFADPQQIVDIDDTVEQLTAILPRLDGTELRKRLQGKTRFQWIARKLTPREQQMIHELGLPGIHFVQEPQRVYPSGAEAAHILGHVNIDNQGMAGIETWIDRAPPISRATAGEIIGSTEAGTLELAMDLGVQHALRSALSDAMTRYRAKAAAGLVMDIHSGEVLALSSLPDYDPNNREQALDTNRLNRLTSGVYELGSVFKVITTAAALDNGTVSLESGYDASKPLKIGGHTIRDFHAKNRWLSVPEIFIYSSNIGSARMALDLGVERHKAFLKKLGLLEQMRTELGDSATPLVPRRWKRVSTMTISFGHGLSVTPLHLAAASAAILNGGYKVEPTFLKRSREEARVRSSRVIKQQTSEAMRYLFRLNVLRGSGKRAEVPGYRVGGKTGTAEKVVNGRYSKSALLNSFLAAFPMDAPEYLVLIMLDEPKATPETGGKATAGVNAAPVAGQVISRIAPMLGVLPRTKGAPRFDEPFPASY